MVHFQYRVIDPEKASSVLGPQVTPYLVDQKSGSKLYVPTAKVGSLRQKSRQPETDRVYSILFANMGN